MTHYPSQQLLEEFDMQLANVRPVTRNLIESVMLDAWPRNAAIVDFGIDSQKHYEALYYPIREGEIMPARLEQALGNGPMLTELARSAPSNPHHDIEFHGALDGRLDGYQQLLHSKAGVGPTREPEKAVER